MSSFGKGTESTDRRTTNGTFLPQRSFHFRSTYIRASRNHGFSLRCVLTTTVSNSQNMVIGVELERPRYWGRWAENLVRIGFCRADDGRQGDYYPPLRPPTVPPTPEYQRLVRIHDMMLPRRWSQHSRSLFYSFSLFLAIWTWTNSLHPVASLSFRLRFWSVVAEWTDTLCTYVPYFLG